LSKPEQKGERLAKFLARAGLASRRASERLIAAREVTVNGRVVTDPAHPVTSLDAVAWRDKPVAPPELGPKTYIMLHKPVGVLTTMKPGKEEGPCVADYVNMPGRIYPVGRLDRESSGMLIMTDDGDLTLRLTHPRHEVEKEYYVKLHRPLIARDIPRIEKGIKVDDRVVVVRDLGPAPGGRLRIVITEGRNRIVRRLFGAIKYNVLELKRIRIGPLSLGRLAVGHWRKLTDKEVQLLGDAIHETNNEPLVVLPPVRRARSSSAS